MNVTINSEQKLFIIPAGEGVTTLGFEYCDGETRQLAEVLRDSRPIPDAGTVEQFLRRQELIGGIGKKDIGTWFHPGTEPAVKRILEYARKAEIRIRIFYGDPESGRDWLEECDAMGYVSRSMGPLKIPILLKRCNSSGGGSILTDNILRIIETGTQCELYRHRNYVEPKFRIRRGDDEQYPFEVHANSSLHARFKRRDEAKRYVDFMRGKRFTQ